MSFRTLMNKRADVLSVATAKDAYGTWTETETTKHSGAPVRIQPMGGQERATYRAQQVEVTHKVFMDAKYSISRGDRIRFGTREFDVEFVRDVDEMGHHLEIEARELTPDTGS